METGSTLCLWTVFCSLVAVSESYDVTTIYRLEGSWNPGNGSGTLGKRPADGLRGSVEIHARTNALGLPFQLHNDSVVNPGIGVDVPECNALHGGCEWTLSSGFKPGSNVPEPPLSIMENSLDGGHEPDLITSGRDISTMRKFRASKLLFSFRPATRSDSPIGILLMDALGSIQRGHLYLVKISQYNSQSYLLKCKPSEQCTDVNKPCEKLQLPNGTKLYCSREVSVSIYYGYWETNTRYNYTVELTAGRVVVTNHNTGGVYFNWTDPTPISVKYYSFTSWDYAGAFSVGDSLPVFSLNDGKGSVKSPMFVPSSSQVCVMVTYYLSPGSENSLQITAQSTSHHLTMAHIVAHKTEDRWRSERFVADIPVEDQQKPTHVIVTATRAEGSKTLIQRISGCNAEDAEDIVVLSSNGPLTVAPVGYSAAVTELADNETQGSHFPDELQCMNGAIYEVKRGECSCQVGFTGKLCEDGCGPNKYGDDCGGFCSTSVTGCRGMLLCRPQLPCDCAPGIKGDLCDTPCAAGEYGAGCRQRCGQCVGSSNCDSYTGACLAGCGPGYFAPLCQQTYKYISRGPELSVNGFHGISVVDMHTEDMTGQGSPRLLQVQYKDEKNKHWLELKPLLLSSDLPTVNITGLLAGVTYHVRTVLIDKDGSCYQGETVPYTEIQTRCTVPSLVPYNVESLEVSEHSFHVKWSYSPMATWCPLSHFEMHLKEGWRWFVASKGVEPSAHVTHKLAGTSHPIKVRAITSNGPANFSPVLTVYTKDQTPETVTNLKVMSEKSSEFQVTWDQPRFTAGKIRRYRITYQCLNLLACSAEECSQSAGSVEATTSSTVVRELLPYAQYNISVAAYAGTWGPAMSILAATDYSVPSIAPVASNKTVSERSNSSITVHWSEVKSCQGLNGFLDGYRYELTLAGAGPRDIILEGTTQDSHVSFKDLKAHTEYETRVYLVSSGGWSVHHALVINAKTKSTIPDTVEHLIVYKRSRRMLGARWAPPALAYGVLESFTVTYQVLGEVNSVKRTVKPTACVAWPRFFCHTILHLRSDTEYIITVQARNSEVAEDGEPTSTHAVTREAAPGPPKNLHLINQTNTSLTVQWHLPHMLNGVLRSFVINIEEVDSFNSTDCCQYFPLQEAPVDQERATYDYELTGLRPASKYTIGVSGKTISLGPAVILTAPTRPPVPKMGLPPQVDLDIRSNEPLPVTLQPSSSLQELVSGYLLLILPQNQDLEIASVTLWDKKLEQELKEAISGPFYVAAEFQQADLEEAPMTHVGTGRLMVDGAFAQVQDPALTSGDTYQLALVTILDYCGARNFGYSLSDSFTMP